MDDPALATNNAMFWLVEEGITKFAELLGGKYIQSRASPDIHRNTHWDEKITTMKLCLVPTLPYAIGLYHAKEDIDLIAIGSMTPKTFFQVVDEKLGLNRDTLPTRDTGSILLSATDPGDWSWLPEKSRVRLTFMRKPDDLDVGCNMEMDPEIDTTGEAKRIHDQISTCKLLDHSSYWTIRHTQPEPGQVLQSNAIRFRLGYLYFMQWAYCSGLITQRRGSTRKNVALSTFYTSAFLGLNLPLPTTIQSGYDMQKIVLQTFTMWINLDSKREHVVGLFKEHCNVIITEDWATSLLSELFRVEMSRVIHTSPAEGFASFVKDYSSYIKIDCQCWIPKKRATAAEDIVDILEHLQRDISFHLRHVGTQARIWPFSLVDPTEGTTHLLGIHHSPHVGLGRVKEAVERRAKLMLTTIGYDTSAMNITYETLWRDEVHDLISRGDLDSEAAVHSPMKIPTHEEMIADALGEAPSKGGDRFRTAHEVINRLTWDPKHASLDYEIGYVDRFEDELMWKDVEVWTKLTEEEDFIPQHRIQVVRRKGDWVIVWDRAKRVDRTDEV